MSTTFLDRNKKKSVLALLLLWWREKRVLMVLLLVVVMASGTFVMPSSMLMRIPGGDRFVAGVAWIAAKLGVDLSKWGLLKGPRSYDELIAAFRAAKEDGRPAGWGAFFGAPRGGAPGGAGSLDLVKGKRSDLESGGGATADGKLPKPGAVSGILNPADAKDLPEGVAIDESELGGEREGLVRNANAGGFFANLGQRGYLGKGSAAGGGAPTAGPLAAGAGAYAGAGFFGGSGGAGGGGAAERIRNALGTTNPGGPAGARIRGASQGRLSTTRVASISARVQRGIAGLFSVNSGRAFAQLADGRGRAALSVSPECAAPGCPGEYATTTSGSIYDGNNITGSLPDVLNVPELGDTTTPDMPDTSAADDYLRQAEQMEADAKKCREADDQYTPQENQLAAELEAKGDMFDSMGCANVGCSKSEKARAERCGQIGQEIQSVCQRYADIRCQHTMACPLTARNGCSANSCTGGKNTRGAQTENVGPDGEGAHAVTPSYVAPPPVVEVSSPTAPAAPPGSNQPPPSTVSP